MVAKKTNSSDGKRIGYVRVSSVDQNDARQLDGVELHKIFTDKASGKNTDRPQLQAMLEFLREGDHLYVHSMDRLSRSLRDLQSVVEQLNSRGICVTFVKEGLRFEPPTTGTDAHQTAYSKLMLQLLGAVSEFERALILERQREGIAIAKAKNVYKGRKNALDKAEIARLKKMAEEGLSKVEIAETLGISRASVYVYLKKTEAVTP